MVAHVFLLAVPGLISLGRLGGGVAVVLVGSGLSDAAGCRAIRVTVLRAPGYKAPANGQRGDDYARAFERVDDPTQERMGESA